MRPSTQTLPNRAASLRPRSAKRADRGDNLLLGVIAFQMMVAIVIGLQYERAAHAFWVGLPLLIAAAAVWTVARERFVAHVPLGLISLAMTALHIRLAFA